MAFELRHARETDLSAEYDVFVAAQGELWHRHGLEWLPSPFEAWSEPHRHLLNEDGERSFVATDGERVIGFSAAFARDDLWFFSALFVLPEYQGKGAGRELVERSWGGDYRRRITITDSIQPVSNGLYARRGLVPTTPILYLSGTASFDSPQGVEAAAMEPDALAMLDRAAYGFDRSVDHRYWKEHSVDATVWLRAGEPIAYAYVTASGLIGPLAGVDGQAAALALRAELARRDGRDASVLPPGTARTLVETALEGGLRISRPPGLLMLSALCDPPQALAISSYWLL